jgi:hypothetical protein
MYRSRDGKEGKGRQQRRVTAGLLALVVSGAREAQRIRSNPLAATP